MIVEEPDGARVLVVWQNCFYCLHRVEPDPEGVMSHYDNVIEQWFRKCRDGHGNEYGTEAKVGETHIFWAVAGPLPESLGGPQEGEPPRGEPVPEHGDLPCWYGRHARR
jgi:hypothetical protein